MIEIQLNGESYPIEPQSNCLHLLARLNYQNKRLAIEINGEIIPKSAHASIYLKAHDKVEIIHAVGGG